MSDPLTDEQLAEIRKRADAATALVRANTWEASEARLCSIDLSRADVPLLLDEVERLRVENKECDRLLDIVRNHLVDAIRFWKENTGKFSTEPTFDEVLTFLLDDKRSLRAWARDSNEQDPQR